MIALVGMPTSGKSTVARELGARLGWPVHDSDDEIQARHGDVLGEHPTRAAWAEFRRIERRVLMDLAVDASGVLAIGGGGWMDEGVRLAFQKRWWSVHLSCSAETILTRLADSPRVMFADVPDSSSVSQLLKERESQYRLATITLPADGPFIEVVRTIIFHLDDKEHCGHR